MLQTQLNYNFSILLQFRKKLKYEATKLYVDNHLVMFNIFVD